MPRPAHRASHRPARQRRTAAPVVALLAALAILLSCAAPAGAQDGGVIGTTPGTAPKTVHVTTPLLSARRVPNLLRSGIAEQRLHASVQDIIKDAPPTSCFEISHNGRTLLRVNGDTPLEPASTNKILTAAAVLSVLPEDAKLSTVITATARPENGTIKGNVWLIGGGDSILTTAGYRPTFEDTAQLSSDFSALADRLKAAGVTRIEGDIVGDDTRYDNVRSIGTWTQSLAREAGPLSALLVNDGTTGYSTSPDAPAKVRKPGDPPVLAAETLKAYLSERGVTVTGGPAAGVAPGGTVELARLDTPLMDVVTEMLAWSDNTTAELLLKEFALQTTKRGTTADGLRTLNEKLVAMGMPTAGLVLNDGSGLDRGDRLTCDLLTELLEVHGPDSALARGMAISGQRGTLRTRMRGTPVEGKVHAKTGTLATVASLAGYETTASGEVLTFAFIQNGQKDGDTVARLDKLAVALHDYPQAPSLEELGPKPVSTS